MKFAYLASPPLVVAFAIAGKVGIDLYTEPLGVGSDGEEVFLKGHLADAAGDNRHGSRVDKPRDIQQSVLKGL